MRQYLIRARQDTFAQAGHGPGLLFLVGVPSLTVAAHLLLWGEREMMDEVPPFISALAALGAAGLVLFLINLVLAPYRLQKERADRVDCSLVEQKREMDKLKADVAELTKQKPNFALRVDSILGAGGDSGHPGKYPLAALITIKNVGTMPSIAEGWRLFAQTTGGDMIQGQLYRFPEVQFQQEGQVVSYTASDLIFEKTSRPIEPGGKVTGLIFAWFDRDVMLTEGAPTILVQTHDIFGIRYETVANFTNMAEGQMRYYPGSGARFRELEVGDNAG